METVLLFSVGKENYNVSTGDTPRHPFRYALGLKSYGIGKDKRLRPRWKEDGRAERPYSGKVDTYLFDPLQYAELNPRHLVSLNYKKRVAVDSNTLSERETSFPAMIPASAIVQSSVVKYPRFFEAYHPYYQHRYGMDKKLYEQFKKDLFSGGPHSRERKRAKFLLGEHLCAYHEACLIEDARLEARKRGGWLVYRDYLNGFSLVPPPINPPIAGEAKIAGDHQREKQNDKVEARRKGSGTGWLEAFMKEHDLQSGSSFIQVLNEFLCISEVDLNIMFRNAKENESEINDWLDHFKIPVRETMVGSVADFFQETLDFLLYIATTHNYSFTIESFLLDTPIKIGHQDAEKSYLLLYMGGDGFYGVLEKQRRDEEEHSPVHQASFT